MSAVPERMLSTWPVTIAMSICERRSTHSAFMFGTYAVGQWKYAVSFQ